MPKHGTHTMLIIGETGKRKWGPGENPRVDVAKMQQIADVWTQGGRFIPGWGDGLPGVIKKASGLRLCNRRAPEHQK